MFGRISGSSAVPVLKTILQKFPSSLHQVSGYTIVMLVYQRGAV